MLSRVIYTAPKDLDSDKSVTIVLTSEKNGFESNPIEVSLTAKAPKQPNDPIISGPEEVEENTKATYNVTFNETETFDADVTVSKGSIKFNALRNAVEFTAPNVEGDTVVTITVTAKRGSKKAETQKVITVKNKIEKSATLVTSSSNPTEVEVESSIDINFDNANGVLKVTETTDTISTLVESNKVTVIGASEGAASFKVSQTETNKTESDTITVNLTVTAKAEQTE